jgi:hypothetical protein
VVSADRQDRLRRLGLDSAIEAKGRTQLTRGHQNHMLDFWSAKGQQDFNKLTLAATWLDSIVDRVAQGVMAIGEPLAGITRYSSHDGPASKVPDSIAHRPEIRPGAR